MDYFSNQYVLSSCDTMVLLSQSSRKSNNTKLQTIKTKETPKKKMGESKNTNLVKTKQQLKNAKEKLAAAKIKESLAKHKLAAAKKKEAAAKKKEVAAKKKEALVQKKFNIAQGKLAIAKKELRETKTKTKIIAIQSNAKQFAQLREIDITRGFCVSQDVCDPFNIHQ
ncbi:unnamed protein product [Chironomus riparius]|uniref:Uncharacterized protein n=1 Tax=Chironomus riparius TaxID=315576 RepID=A0A9P0J4B9_9DIPT|nr:unnamed protein product [Chironomus riparius]